MKRIRALTKARRNALNRMVSLWMDDGVRSYYWGVQRGDHRYWMAVAQQPELEMKTAEIGNIADCAMFVNGKRIA
jgi:hypothetical protein